MLALLLEKASNGQWESEVHSFAFDDLYILLDINSGSVHILDEISWNIVEAVKKSKGNEEYFKKQVEKYTDELIKEAIVELNALIAEGILFGVSVHSMKDISNNFDNVIKSLCLNISHDCNLACSYCFAGKGNFGGPKNNMSFEVGKKALDFLIENSGNRPTCEVDFFGGEPLLNWGTVKKLVEYGKEKAALKNKRFRFTLTTNGLLLNPEKEEFLNRENISVVLSIDGRKEIHDKMRPVTSGVGSYDLISPKIKSLVKSRDEQNYYVRGTFTRENMDFTEDVAFLADEGYSEISLEPVVADPLEDYAFKEEDRSQLKDEYKKLVKEYLKRKELGKPFNFFHFNVDLENGPCLPKRITGCGAGFQYLAVTPEGQLYPCHQFVGKEEYLLGDLSRGIVNKELVEKFKQAHIYNKECKVCWARYLCSGGCHANAVNHNGLIEKPYEMGCFLQKVRLEAAIYLFVKKKQELSCQAFLKMSQKN
ncbi:MAG: radical SAM protein [Desulfitibacter sp. BRH_c19]|nr:MAG: radical SAM protein [Desulfitibacter sp. BRH_c19]